MHSLAEFTLPASNRAASARFWGVNSNKKARIIKKKEVNSIAHNQNK
jgi:hypothetical protein